MEYRIFYVENGGAQQSTQYYNVYHSSEALQFLAHTFRRGHIDCQELKVLKIEEFDRFAGKWINRTDKAVEHAAVPELCSEGDEVWLRRES